MHRPSALVLAALLLLAPSAAAQRSRPDAPSAGGPVGRMAGLVFPKAAFSADPTSGLRPLSVAFSNESVGHATGYLWDFGDGQTSTAKEPVHEYTAQGTYTVTLTVSGVFTASVLTRTDYVTVLEPPPTADFEGNPTSGVAPLSVSFQDTSTGGLVTSWAWDLGDSSTSTLANPIHVYTTPGTYPVSLSVGGPGGSDGLTRTDYVTVLEPPPVADFMADPTSGVLPLSVDFTDATTGPVTSWSWDFGDTGTSSDPSPTHVYTDPGTYDVTLTATGPGGVDSEVKSGFVTVDAPVPEITTTLRRRNHAQHRLEIVFDVTVTDPNGDDVSLRLLDPRPGIVFEPVENAPSPLTVPVRWQVHSGRLSSGPTQMLQFEARNATYPDHAAREVVVTDLLGGNHQGSLLDHADLVGDSILDLVVYGLDGAIHIFRGREDPSPVQWANLRQPGVNLVKRIVPDISGDGYPDVIAGQSGGGTTILDLLVFRGGSHAHFTPSPWVALHSDGMHYSSVPQLIQVGDVTGDGYDDVVKAEPTEDSSDGVGALYVWAGGPDMSATQTAKLYAHPAQRTDLTDPGASTADFYLEDVTGDGVLDIVASGPWFNGTEEGVVLMWAGGPGLTGDPLPTATLTRPGAVDGDRLGDAGLYLAEVTGDAYPDVIVGSRAATVGGTPAVGEFLIWAGGPTLTGTPAPVAILNDPDAYGGISGGLTPLWGLGSGRGVSLLLSDVTGDGTDDLVIMASVADLVAVDTGAILVWEGGPGLVGTPASHATLVRASPTSSSVLSTGSLQGFFTVDVTGDGVNDIVSGAPTQTVGGVVEAGALYVWAGGSALTGTVTETAQLVLAAPAALDHLGLAASGNVVQFRDVTDDGTLDIVANTVRLSIGGVNRSGGIAVWAGGGGLAGTVTPTALLTIPGAHPDDMLGYVGSDAEEHGQAVQLQDVTGDGIPDIVAPAILWDSSTVTDAGAIFVWAGGAGLSGVPAPTATLTAPSRALGSNVGAGVWVAEVTGDGTLDIVASSPNYHGSPGLQTGIIYVWQGGGSLTGTPAPLVGFEPDDLGQATALGSAAAGQGFLLFDMTGDGLLDLVASSFYLERLYFWKGPLGPASAFTRFNY